MDFIFFFFLNFCDEFVLKKKKKRNSNDLFIYTQSISNCNSIQTRINLENNNKINLIRLKFYKFSRMYYF